MSKPNREIVIQYDDTVYEDSVSRVMKLASS